MPAVNRTSYTLAALGFSSDTFGTSTGDANMLDIDGTYISIASKTATQAKQAINDLNLTGVSAM